MKRYDQRESPEFLASFLIVLCVILGMSGSPAAALSLIPIAQDFEPSGREATQTFRLQSPFENGDSLDAAFVIHTMHVDTGDTRPHGRDRAEDEALSDRSHR
jgi:hypothetical protein